MKRLLQWFRHCFRRCGRLKPRISLSPGRRGDIRRIRFIPGKLPDDVDAELAQALHQCMDAQSCKLEERLERLDSRLAEQGRLVMAALTGENGALAEALCGTHSDAGAVRKEKRQVTECVTWKSRPGTGNS